MKKLFALCCILSILAFSANNVFAQNGEENTTGAATEAAEGTAEEAATEEAAPMEEEEETVPDESAAKEAAPVKELHGHQLVKKYFIDGGWEFMTIVLVCLLLGLMFAIERIITLNLATTNTKKLLGDIEVAVQAGNIDQAKEICKSTRGPVASIFYQGLERMDEGIEIVEKSIVAYGSVQMGLLERGLIWISLFISLAPMLGFMGTVIGMIIAFDKIEAMGDISPSVVAGGIKVALLTTVFGLVVAIILQIFYNYIVSKIDDIVNNMEDASISFVDILVRSGASK